MSRVEVQSTGILSRRYHGTKFQKIFIIGTAVKASQKTEFFDPTHKMD
jgi:hypothetical protein